MVDFIPDKLEHQRQELPFFEDSQEAKVPGWRLTKSEQYYRDRVADLLARLGGGAVVFMPGEYPGRPKRFGYRITFNVNGIPARLDVAALPFRHAATDKKKQAAMSQALFLVGNWLEAELHSWIYRPGVIPLVPFLIGEGDRTVTEALVESRMLPLLPGANGQS